MKGIARDARIFLSPISQPTGHDSADAILRAAGTLRRGDILLIEVGVAPEGYPGKLPVEYEYAEAG